MNEKEFLNSQKAAIERMREMNSRSRFNDNRKNQNFSAPPVKPKGNTPEKNKENPPKPRPQPDQRKENNTKKEHNNSIFAGLNIPFLDKIMNDSDTVIIIGLLLILMSENADKRLLFALIYILL